MAITIEFFRNLLWQQFGAAIDTLENTIDACPEELWTDQSKHHLYWYTAYHTIFWLDYYLSDKPDDFLPPEPFTLSEFDPAGVIPEKPYTKNELLKYVRFCREKCRNKINEMTEEGAQVRWKSGWMDFSIYELCLYNMRHVQHHAAQLNLMLREHENSATRWVSFTKLSLNN